MGICYKKLWKLLIDKDMKKKELSTIAGISQASITKMGRNGHVSTETLMNCEVSKNEDLFCSGLWYW